MFPLVVKSHRDSGICNSAATKSLVILSYPKVNDATFKMVSLNNLYLGPVLVMAILNGSRAFVQICDSYLLYNC